jgi:two-component system LytT family response regulator
VQGILLRDHGQIFPIAVPEIESLKGDARYTAIAACGQLFSARLALADLEPQLPPERFLRVQRKANVKHDLCRR